MLHSPQHNNKIKHLHERCLRLIHNDKLSSYKKHIEKDGPVFVHHRNIQRLTIKMFQIKCGQSLEIATGIFKQTKTTGQFQTKARLYYTLCEHSLSWFQKQLLFKPKNLGNHPRKNLRNQFS